MKIKLSKELANESLNEQIWQITMLVRELRTFKKKAPLSKIEELNQNGYNHIIIFEKPNHAEYAIIARTAILVNVVDISKKNLAKMTCNEIIDELLDLEIDLLEQA